MTGWSIDSLATPGGASAMQWGATSWSVRADVRRVAIETCSRFRTTWNTYENHPPGLGLDEVSVDFWGPGGRGDRLGRLTRRRIARYLRRRKGAPHYRWIINGQRGYYPSGARFTPPGGAEWNAGHVHVTYQ